MRILPGRLQVKPSLFAATDEAVKISIFLILQLGRRASLRLIRLMMISLHGRLTERGSLLSLTVALLVPQVGVTISISRTWRAAVWFNLRQPPTMSNFLIGDPVDEQCIFCRCRTRLGSWSAKVILLASSHWRRPVQSYVCCCWAPTLPARPANAGCRASRARARRRSGQSLTRRRCRAQR